MRTAMSTDGRSPSLKAQPDHRVLASSTPSHSGLTARTPIVRLIQLKGGHAGVSGPEIARLKKAATGATVKWLIAAFDGELLHVVPEDSDV